MVIILFLQFLQRELSIHKIHSVKDFSSLMKDLWALKPIERKYQLVKKSLWWLFGETALSREKFPLWFLVFNEFLVAIYFTLTTDSGNSWPHNGQPQISHQRLRKSFAENSRPKKSWCSPLRSGTPFCM